MNEAERQQFEPTITIKCLDLAEALMREVCPITSWTCEQDRQSQWEKRKDKIAWVASHYVGLARASESSPPQPESLDEIARRIGYPAKEVSEWAQSHPESAYTALWNEIVRLVGAAATAPSAPPTSDMRDLAFVAWQVLGAEWGLYPGKERARICNWFWDVAHGARADPSTLFPVHLGALQPFTDKNASGGTEEFLREGKQVAYEKWQTTSHLLNNLLAVIHRDGGHYVADHGLTKAVEDATSIVVQLLERNASGGESPLSQAATEIAGLVLGKLKVEGFNQRVQTMFKNDVRDILVKHSLAIDLRRETDLRWLAEVPSIPGCMAYGRTQSEAVIKVGKLLEQIEAEQKEN